ncbi:hypothetical protein [Inhella gelatinilytica]|uniref:5-bromo-4-chloroindolyl phosphate hydrolysis protein n=1 Tax=Inhella gelatinilytica TaxID=2795030 RepID=A0A931NE94_9BURK|nr:hypothetical protein [Inhella gelatinilytica]MBH9553922.1 hypothetical protein [Inhella gelatinilytica]
MNGLLRWVNAPANWLGLGAATAVLVLKGLGLLGGLGLGVAALGYGAGFVVGGLWWGWPSTREDFFEALDFKDEGDAREAMGRALSGVRRLTEHNPGQRISPPLRQRIFSLCDALETLLDQWERSRGNLSLQETFHARHIAIRYLPEALNTYLSIPSAFAATKLLANGQTAQATFEGVLGELEGKVVQLGDDLAAQDAQAFLTHSEFLKQKFGAPVERLKS